MAKLPHFYGGAQGLSLLEGLDERGRLVFTAGDALEVGAARSLGPRQIYHLLLRLEAAGLTRRIRRGLYAVTGKLPGSSAPHDYAIATALYTPSALSHRTALHVHGLSEQVSRVIVCTTTARVVTPSMRSGKAGRRRRASTWTIDGLEIQYVSVNPARFFGIEDIWADERTRVSITDRERTMLDLIADPARSGGLGEALAVLEGHHSELDLPKLVLYAVRLGVVAVAKRLGWALESFGVDDAVLAPLLDLPAKGLQALDPQRARQGRVIRRWRLLDNLATGRLR
jgi:predicted transcriptional regulator of viral defense system